jgi:signal transduction histidine kinase
MDHKATLNGSPAQALARDVAGMARDVAGIVELQARLFALDLQVTRAALKRGASAYGAAAIVLFTALPVGWAAFGLWLADVTALTVAGGLLASACSAIALVVCLAVFGTRQFRAQQAAFENSRKELSENLAAIKQVLTDYLGRASEEE